MRTVENIKDPLYRFVFNIFIACFNTISSFFEREVNFGVKLKSMRQDLEDVIAERSRPTTTGF